MDTRNGNGRFYDCPACGQRKRKSDKHLVCYNCHQDFVQAAGAALVRGVAISEREWVLPRAKRLFASLNNQLKDKQIAYKALQDSVGEDAFAALKTITKKFVQKEIFAAAVAAKKKELWAERNGNRLYAEKMALEQLMQFINGTVREIEAQLAEEQDKVSTEETNEDSSDENVDDLSEDLDKDPVTATTA